MISKMLGGFITIQSKEGCGSTFSLHLKITPINNSQRVDIVQPQTKYVYTPCETEIKEEKINGSDNFLGKCSSNDLIPGDNDLNCDSNRPIKGIPFILIVDDEKGNRTILSSYLKKLHLKCFEAKNGLEALELVKLHGNSIFTTNQKVIIFMDSNMPIMNGETSSVKIREFLNRINAEPPTIICVTANEEVNRKGSPDNVYDETVYKPIKFERLKTIINRLLMS